MVAKIKLKVERDEYGFLIDGKREYEFQSGVKYILTSEHDLWATWENTDIYTKTMRGKTDVIPTDNMTCPDHHRYVSTAQLYYVLFKTVADLHGVPVGLWDKEIDELFPTEVDHDIELYMNEIVLPYRKFMTNGTFEDLFNLEQEDYIPPHEYSIVNSDTLNQVIRFPNNERYLAVVLDGKRVSPNDYVAEFISNSDSHKIFLNYPLDGEIVLKTDLCHNVRQNGSKEIEVLFREGDERKFFISDYNRSNRSVLTIKGSPAPENKISIRGQFDQFILDKYPQIYDFLMAYYDLENTQGTAQSYLRNMIEYSDVDRMPEDVLRRKIRNLFTPFDSTMTDARHLVKRLNDFFRNKGNMPSYKWMTNVLFQKKSKIHRFSDDVIKLSYGEWTEYVAVMISEKDIENLNRPSVRRMLGSVSDSNDEVANSLVGHMIEGRTSTTVAVVERVEKNCFQRRPFYRVICSVKSGEFLQDELIDIRRIDGQVTINANSYNSHEIGIIGAEILNPSNGYVPGQEIIVSSITGDGFKGHIGRVGANGEVKQINIENQGWFYRPYLEEEVSVENDLKDGEKPFDFENIDSEKVVFTNEYAGYTVLGGEILGIDVDEYGTHVNGRWTINKTGYMYSKPLATSEVADTLYFFGRSLDSKKILIVNTRDEARELKVSFDSDIINIFSNARTLFVLTSLSLYSFDMSKILDPIPPVPTRFQMNSQYGTIRSVFVLGTNIFGFTDDKFLLQFGLNGSVVRSTEFSSAVDFAAYVKIGKVNNLYLAFNNELSIYQWYDGNPRLKAKPIYGRIAKVKNHDEIQKHSISGHSVLNDNNIYQDFSLGIVLDVTTNNYMKTFEDNINTAGFKYYGIVRRDSGNLSTGSLSIGTELFIEGYNLLIAKSTADTYSEVEALLYKDVYGNVIVKSE